MVDILSFGMVLNRFFYLLEIVKLLLNLIELFLVVLGNYPDLQ